MLNDRLVNEILFNRRMEKALKDLHVFKFLKGEWRFDTFNFKCDKEALDELVKRGFVEKRKFDYEEQVANMEAQYEKSNWFKKLLIKLARYSKDNFIPETNSEQYRITEAGIKHQNAKGYYSFGDYLK